MSRHDARIYGDIPRPAETYRAARSNRSKYPQHAELLRTTRIRRGITRRELDREREAVRRFILDGHTARGFTSGQLHALAQQMFRKAN